MADNLKSLITKVNASGPSPQGSAFAWTPFPQEELKSFTKHLQVPKVAVDEDGHVSADIGAIVSGMPTVFARANLFKNAFDNITNAGSSEKEGIMIFYQSLLNEWKGLISCIALDYKNINVERIFLVYSDGKNVRDTNNIYEPAGSFGNILFDRQTLWSDQTLASNAQKKPFIDVISFAGKVVGATSPDSFLFTSVSYKLESNIDVPYINIKTGKFIDPLYSNLSGDQLFQIYSYAKHILDNIEEFRKYFSSVDVNLHPDYQKIHSFIELWMNEMIKVQKTKGYPALNNPMPPEVGRLFKEAPFSSLFNYSTELWGNEGVISDNSNSGFLFKPENLLLPHSTQISQIEFGSEASDTKNYLHSKPIILLTAETKGMSNHFSYFTLPLTALALNVFGRNLEALLGYKESDLQSRLSAIYDPAEEKLIVDLKIVTNKSKVIIKRLSYRVLVKAINGNDILIWPNFISKQWNRYFMYSEIPHTGNEHAFQAFPFAGDVDASFKIIVDDDQEPLFLAKAGKATDIPEKYGKIKTQLHISSNNAVADNKYKYEIYESNQPFKGVKFAHANVDCGYGLIRYDRVGNNDKLPLDLLDSPNIPLAAANIGFDFGSTNSSIAYFSESENKICSNLKFKNRRISLLGNDNKNNNERPAVEDEIFFFQNDEIFSNSIKSVLTIHDPRRIANEEKLSNEALAEKNIKGGFPCFEKNLPIESATDNRYILNYSRSGKAELIHNMKWSTLTIDKSYKTAYLSSLMLHVYAELFVEKKHEPHTLKWSYPSSMGKNLLTEYRAIWDNLKHISPIVSEVMLKVYPPADLSNINLTENTFAASNNDLNKVSGWGEDDPVGTDNWGFSSNKSSTVSTHNEWDTEKSQPNNSINIEINTDPLNFDFKPLANNESFSEACAVANYLISSSYSVLPNELLLCFDIGGSTTDISVLCAMDGGKAMIKQNSIRFAAQRVAQATKFSPNFKNVLLKTCEKKGIKIEGLNNGIPKFSESTAPYYFEQLVDRLDDKNEFEDFYKLIAADCKDMMCVNLYVTGLIMYYAGQLTYKLRQELIRSEGLHSRANDKPPKIRIAFAGKGSRIFDWFAGGVDAKAADKYYTEMFIKGLGGMNIAKETITPINFPDQIIDINSSRSSNLSDIKYEVSKGLAHPTNLTNLLVPQNKQAIEILGEENFCVITPSGEYKYLNYDNSITPEMLEYIGDRFICSPQTGKDACPKFMEFANIFFNAANDLFGLRMTKDDFLRGFNDMNIESYIKKQPEYINAQKRKMDEQKKFDYVMPIIILEGMKFMEDHLLKGIQK